jgi:hypothetical protein
MDDRGFAVIPDVFSPAEMGDLLAAMPAGGRAGTRHLMRNPTVADFARDPRLLDLASRFLGSTAIPYRATFFAKVPLGNWLVPWHQDTALPLTERREKEGWGPWSVKNGVIYALAPARALEQVIALRVHLDDSDALNGPLRVLSCTHGLGLLTDEEISDLKERTSAIDCLVACGGVIAMRPLIVHASSKARSDKPRRVLHIEYTTALDIEGMSIAIA